MTRAVAIIGTGLIGASIGLALRRGRRPPEVIGWDKRRSSAAAAKRRGAVTRIARSADEAMAEADVVVLAAPLEAILELIPSTFACARTRALILDVAGLQRPTVAAAARELRRRKLGARFVSAHPLAGRERAGPDSAMPDLFSKRPMFLSAPPQPAREEALRAAASFARRLGAVPVQVDPLRHDRLIAFTSALPQVVAVSLALTAAGAGATGLKLFGGPGLADATRLAQSPYSVWRGPLGDNRRNVQTALRRFESILCSLAGALARGDHRLLERSFSAAAAARRRLGRAGREGTKSTR